MGCYYTLCHNTYAYSLLFYKVCMKRENAGSWNYVAGKGENIRDLFCTTPKVLKLHESFFGINKKYWAKKVPEGAHTLASRVGARPTPLGVPPASWAPRQPSDVHLLLYEVFHRGKNHNLAHGMKLRRHEAEPI